MPKRSERDAVVSDLSSKIFSDMLEDVLMDVVLQAHQEVLRSRVVCEICHTRCGDIHAAGSSASGSQGASPRVPSPPGAVTTTDTNGVAGTGSNDSTTNGKSDGIVYYDCVVCGRSIGSSRYAVHLSSCMGLGNSRRGAARSVNVNGKSKSTPDGGRSASPYIPSETGHISDEGKSNPKGKVSKAKRTDEAEFSLNRKRPNSPSVSPNKKQKKSKNMSSPLSHGAKADADAGSNTNTFLAPTISKSKAPSKLRASSTLSSAQRDQRSSSPGSPTRSSSPAHSLSTAASGPSLRSPALSAATLKKTKQKNGKIDHIPPPRKPSPPRPPPPPPMTIPEPHFLVDVEGDETGSSTDTDSS